MTIFTVTKGKHICIILLSSSNLGFSTVLKEGIEMEDGGRPHADQHHCNVCHDSKLQFGDPHSDGHFSLCIGKISSYATDGLFRQTEMLGNNFQVHASSPSFFLLRFSNIFGIYFYSFDQSSSIQVICLTFINSHSF